MKYRISRARSAREHVWKLHEYTLDELHNNGFDFHRESDNKDGIAFCPCALIGTRREAKSVSELSLFVYDVDGKQTYDDIKSRIVAAGLEAIIYTTYNHRATKTHVRTDQYKKWAQRSRKSETHNEETIKQYLKDTDKGHLVVTKVHATPVQTNDGINILIEHEPIDKVRILLPMAKPFILAEHGYTHGEAVQNWKKIYVGIGNTLGFEFDKACQDVARLHYYPSHPPGDTSFKIERIQGKLIDFANYAPADLKDTFTKHRETSPNGTLIDDESAIFENFNVGEWFYHQGRGIGAKLMEVLTDNNPDLIGRDRGSTKDGWHITCPFESEHTTTGGSGTFIDPMKEDEYPKVHCCHNHCLGRKTEAFLAGMLEQGWLTRQELVAIGRRAPQEAALAAVGLNPATLGTPKVAEEDETEVDISKAGPAAVDDGQRNVIAQIRAMAEKAAPLPDGIFDKLEFCRAGVEVKEVIQEAISRGAEDSRASHIFCLAVSGMTMRGVKMYYGAYASDLEINHMEFLDIVAHVRNKLRPLNARIDLLANASLQNEPLRNEIKYLADYYAMPYAEMHRIYLKARDDVSSDVVAELNRRASEMNDRYAKWLKATDTYLIDLEKTKEEGVVRQYTHGSLKKMLSNVIVTQKTKKGDLKTTSVFDYWMTYWPLHTIYDRVVFEPQPKQRLPKTTLNVFQGFKNLTPKVGDPSSILNHLMEVWCQGDVTAYNWLITYIANIFQNPGIKYPTAVAVIGGQGAGKSLVFEKGLVPMATPYATVSQRRDDISGRFNSAMENKLIFVAEETMFSGDHQTSSKLKALIAGDHVQVERKGLEVEEYANFIRFFFLSNDLHTLKVEADDRRYLILEVSKKYVGNGTYFANLAQWLDNGGREIWLNFLLNWNPENVGLRWDSLYIAPRTNSKVDQIAHSLTPVEQYIVELTRHGYVSGVKPNELPEGNMAWMLDEPCYVLEKKWEGLWDAYLRSLSGAGRFSRTHLKPTIRKMMDGVKYRVPMRLAENEPSRSFVVLPPRREALTCLLQNKYLSQTDYDETIALGDGEVT